MTQELKKHIDALKAWAESVEGRTELEKIGNRPIYFPQCILNELDAIDIVGLTSVLRSAALSLKKRIGGDAAAENLHLIANIIEEEEEA